MSIKRLKTIFWLIIKQMYRYMFHEEMTIEVETFLNSLIVILIGMAISTLFSTIFTILGGRKLGPEEYGKFVLVQTISMFLYIPMISGFSAAVIKYASEKPDADRQSKIISTYCILVLLCTLVSIVLYIIFISQLAHLLSISPDFFFISLIFTIMFVLYTVTTSILRSLSKTRAYAFSQVLYGSVLLIIFLVFVLDRSISFKFMVYSMITAYGASSIAIIIFSIRKIIKLNFVRSWAILLSKYSAYSLIGAVSFVLYNNFDNLLINKYFNVVNLGIYNAYSLASINVVGFFSGTFLIVFFPTVSKYVNKGIIFKRMNKSIPYLILLGFPLVFLCEFIILKLYGNSYPLDALWMIIFPIAGISVAINSLYGWLLSSVGLSGAKISSFAALILVIVIIGLNIMLIPKMGITGAVISIILSYTSSTAINIYFGKKYLST